MNRCAGKTDAAYYIVIAVCLICALLSGGAGVYVVIGRPIPGTDGAGQFLSLVVALTALVVGVAFLISAIVAAVYSRRNR